MELKGKGIVVTGASSGIGLHLARRLVKAGARVVGVSRRGEAISDLLGDEIHAISCDLRDPAQMDAMLEEARKVLDGIDILVSNAGFAYYGPLGPPDWDKTSDIFKTNVQVPIYLLQKLAQDESRKVTFMLTLSGLSKMVLPGFSLYGATKFALDGFIRTYRMERPPHVKVIPVYPVATLTRFWNKAGGRDTPIPFPLNTVGYVAWCMEMGLRLGARSVYPSMIFLLRCLLARVLPIDLLVQGIERLRFSAWRRRHGV